jgi:predicted Zn-dependent protease
VRELFLSVFEQAASKLTGAEVLLGRFSGERSDFVRFNRGQVRQPGNVEQAYLTLELILGKRHATSELSLSGDAPEDVTAAVRALSELRELMAVLPEDPYLLYNQEVASTETTQGAALLSGTELVEYVLHEVRGLDFVGLLAKGPLYRGFANSLGQRNWYEAQTFSLDFSLYAEGDKAVKAGLAGSRFEQAELALELQRARQELSLLSRPARSIPTGEHDVYLAPAALEEIFGLLSWGGFGLRSQRTRTSALSRMLHEGARLRDSLEVSEDLVSCSGPDFQSSGFIKPPRVPLIQGGQLVGALTSPRSAREYGVEPNGAGDEEAPSALSVGAGSLPMAEAAARLGRGLYINNLHYLNYSDRAQGRFTGMTRFAAFWVEGGETVAPVSVMRFDESLYRVFGENLEALSSERRLRPSTSTYGSRSTSGMLLPGAQVRGFRFTL